MTRAATHDARAGTRLAVRSRSMRERALAVCVGWMLAGCGGPIAEAVGSMPRPAIQESLRTFEDPETRRMLAEVLSMPEVRGASRELISNLTDGTLDALDDDQRRERIAALTDRFVADVSR